MRRCKNRSAVMAARSGGWWLVRRWMGWGRMRGLADDCCPHPPCGHLPPLAGEGRGCQRSRARRESEYVDKSTRPEGPQARGPGGQKARGREGQESGRPEGKRARRQEDEKARGREGLGRATQRRIGARCQAIVRIPSPACGRRWRAAPDEGCLRHRGSQPHNRVAMRPRLAPVSSPQPLPQRENGDCRAAQNFTSRLMKYWRGAPTTMVWL